MGLMTARTTGAVRAMTMNNGIYDDGATYGPDPDATPAQADIVDPIYDDGAQYGSTGTTEP